MSQWCTVKRGDAEPSYQPPDCDHAVCLEDIRLHALGYDHASLWECPSGLCVLNVLEDSCEEQAGHTGPHTWPPRLAPVLSPWICLPVSPALAGATS